MKKNQNIERTNIEPSDLELEQQFIAEFNFDVECDNYLHSDIAVSYKNNCFTTPFLSSCDVRDGTFETRPLTELGNAKRLEDDRLGHRIFHEETNGLKRSGAIIRIWRRILINKEKFFAWLEGQNDSLK